MVYKMNESIIVIQAEATSPNRTNVVFWSHDRGTAKLRMKLVRKNGIPQSLPEGTTVPIRLMFKSATAEGGYGKHDYLATVEDPVNGIVSIVLEDNILGYVGTVEGSVYIDFPNDRSLDTAGRFTFYIKRSPIDDSTPELEDYYFNGFSQTIDKIEKILADGKQEIDQKIAESETQIDAKVKDTNDKITKANQDVATLNTNIDKANDRIDQTNQQIGDLGKLKKMYSNSLEFGGYDYSGNPNLMPYITDPWVGSLLANGDTVKDSVKRVITHTKTRTADTGDVLSLGLGIPRTAEANNRYLITALRPSTPYALTVTMSVGSDWTGETNTIGARVRYLNESGGTELPINVLLPANVERDKMITHTFTGTTKANLTGMKNCYVQIFSVNSEDKGTVSVSYDVKLEIGTIATPYQPNLLNAPYYLSKVALGENLIKPESQQPVTNSNYLIKIYNTKPMVKGKKYTITLEGTKPATQVFRPFFTQATGSPWGFGDLKPVEGLTDIWSATFTASTDSHPTSPQVQIYQVPNTSVGQCTIKWLKLEEGNTRTPNISQFKYFGEGLKDSNNPNDYSWDVTPEYTEKGLNDTVSLTEPQSVEGLKNFEDGLQIAGKEVATVPEDTGWVNLTAINGHSWNKQGQIRRIGKLVMFRGSLKGSTLSTQDFCTIPEGFRPSNPTDNYEYQFLLPPQSSNTLDNGGMAYIRPNGVCGLPSFRGTANLFLAPIQYYID
ncbi:BppU family phage baseplate upper protein [Enterococcus faecium]|uniref:BppU family phage baseplate upper protein n=2 Tax=Enterococcus faecium TaxID=1352 RepID=UPI0011D19934|nr:BppU family phage baseplate upper protein [Enterococcus faecium]EGP4847433.1 BppU family phage baseplate upper protein [Enterococcus faecium]MCD5054303.1 BppU family phage baseplate upper protein [Enterococcus faecium]MCD5137380.1 BppU family phage baseplate upper protein [Enterococcus faecium]MCD5145204.1 BppU family phage baseplate upper protein [Enterococcus faecium]MCD5165417.1 BppU family phage baseplate upper protein [Enterococcus faecium]